MQLYILCDGITKEPLDASTKRKQMEFLAHHFLESEGYAPLLMTYELHFDELTGITRLEKATQ